MFEFFQHFFLNLAFICSFSYYRIWPFLRCLWANLAFHLIGLDNPVLSKGELCDKEQKIFSVKQMSFLTNQKYANKTFTFFRHWNCDFRDHNNNNNSNNNNTRYWMLGLKIAEDRIRDLLKQGFSTIRSQPLYTQFLQARIFCCKTSISPVISVFAPVDIHN